MSVRRKERPRNVECDQKTPEKNPQTQVQKTSQGIPAQEEVTDPEDAIRTRPEGVFGLERKKNRDWIDLCSVFSFRWYSDVSRGRNFGSDEQAPSGKGPVRSAIRKTTLLFGENRPLLVQWKLRTGRLQGHFRHR